MKKLYLLSLLIMSVFATSQTFCSIGLPPDYTFYPNTTTVQTFTGFGAVVSLCGPNTILYDTVSPMGGCRIVYLNSGTKYQANNIGCPTNNEIYAKNNSTVVVTADAQATIYYEPNATIINMVTNPGGINTVSCTSISFPTVSCNASGIKSNSLNNENLILYPNPAQDQINLSFENNNKDVKKVSIYNSLGELIREQELIFKNKNAVINTKDLPNGVYFLQLFDSAQSDSMRSLSKRFVIAR